MVLAAVAFVDPDAAGFDLGQRRPVRQLWPQSVAVEKLPCIALAWSTNWLPLGLVAGVARAGRIWVSNRRIGCCTLAVLQRR